MKMAPEIGMQSIAEHLSPEARQWLRMNPNPHGFATNRFGKTENALDFVERLYASGAIEVRVEDPFVDSEGLPYADTLLVLVPATDEARWTLERFCEEEGPGDVPPGDFTMHTRRDHISLWWD